MHYSLAYQLGERSGALDPDAKAYIAAVETAGATVTSGQKKAINTFVKTGKSDGWYSSIKRLYLPIWADSAANAIDMVTRTSGTFTASGVTHASGYVQGDGATGYFDFGSSPSALGLTTASLSHFWLAYNTSALAAPWHMGAIVTTTNRCGTGWGSASSTWFGYAGDITTSAVLSSSARTGGVCVHSREGGKSSIFRRQTSGYDTVSEKAHSDVGTIPSTINLIALAVNNAGTAAAFSDVPYGAYGCGMGLSSSASETFTLALKNLWETASGLTLP